MGGGNNQAVDLSGITDVFCLYSLFGFLCSLAVLCCLRDVVLSRKAVRLRRKLVFFIACGDALSTAIKTATTIIRMSTDQPTVALACQALAPVECWAVTFALVNVCNLAHYQTRISGNLSNRSSLLKRYIMSSVVVASLGVGLATGFALQCDVGWTASSERYAENFKDGMCDMAHTCWLGQAIILATLVTVVGLLLFQCYEAHQWQAMQRVQRQKGLTQWYIITVLVVFGLEVFYAVFGLLVKATLAQIAHTVVTL